MGMEYTSSKRTWMNGCKRREVENSMGSNGYAWRDGWVYVDMYEDMYHRKAGELGGGI